MPGLTRCYKLHRPLSRLLVLGCIVGGVVRAQQPVARPAASPNAAFTVDATVALASLISLSDGHLQKMADFLDGLAASDAARSADWSRISVPLADVARHNVPALVWFALPDGSYWTVGSGKATGNLAGRAYFSRLLAGHAVFGDLVVSTATKKSVAIVAVPVRGTGGAVVGVLGSSIYLDSLSVRLAREMNLPDDITFYSIDAQPIGALNRNVDLIFTEPLALGPDLSRAIRQMMSRDEGVVSYDFMNGRRTVVYRKSPRSGWWYAVGLVKGGPPR
jgi:hypothetical protein